LKPLGGIVGQHNMKKYLLILVTLSLYSNSFGQTKKYVEEIALYHLDSLVKIDPVFKDFKYFTNGYVEKFKTSADDTSSAVMKVRPNLFIKTPFKDLTIVEDTTIKSFYIPRRLRKKGGQDALDIFRFIRIGQEYFVLFRIEHKDGGQTALIIMDIKGNLLRRGLGYYIY
jgi:hypothetical protein